MTPLCTICNGSPGPSSPLSLCTVVPALPGHHLSTHVKTVYVYLYRVRHLSSVKHGMLPGSVGPNMLWADPQGAAWVFQMLSVDRLNYMPHTCTAVIQIFIFVIVIHET